MGKTRGNHHPNGPKEEEIIDGLLGPDEDFLEARHAEEFLLAFGIDPTTLISEFKDHLEERARQHQSEQGTVPPSITGALRGIRDRIKSSNPMNVDPTSHIDLLLQSGLVGGRAAGTFARAFRQESHDELCDEDKILLDELEAELDRYDQNSTK